MTRRPTLQKSRTPASPDAGVRLFLWLIFDGVSITRKILMQKRFRVQHSESSRLQFSQEMTIVRNQNPCGLLSIQMRILGLKELTSLLAQCVNYLLFGCTHL